MEDILGNSINVGNFVSYGGHSGNVSYNSVGIVKEIIMSGQNECTGKEQYKFRVRGIRCEYSANHDKWIREIKSKDGFLSNDSLLVINENNVPEPFRTKLLRNLDTFLSK